MHAVLRRTLVRLSVSFALMWATVSMVAGPGSAALVAITGDLAHAGLFIALFYVAAALGAAVGGRLMDRSGRRPVLVAGLVVAAVGYAAAGQGVAVGSLVYFVAGVSLLAAGFGTVNLTRVAAAEMFPPAERGRGVAWVQVSATVGAVVGPLLLVASGPLGHLLGRPPLTLVWWFAPPLLLVAAAVLWRAEEPMAIARDLATYHPRMEAGTGTAVSAAPGPVLVGGAVALAAAQAAMAALMGVAGAAVTHAGHSVEILGGLMFLHFVGMFGLSRVVGRFADQVGRRVTVLIGLALLAAGGATTAAVPGVFAFGVGLSLAGFGWSFAFIGATVLLADVTAPARRARVMGRADLFAQLAGAAVATGGGYWYATNGTMGLGVLAVIVVALPAVFLAFFVAERRPGAYGGPASRDA